MENEHPHDTTSGGKPIFKSRPDVQTAEIIEVAVAHLSKYGREVAEAYLAENDVPWRTAMRVLTAQCYRRRTPPPG